MFFSVYYFRQVQKWDCMIGTSRNQKRRHLFAFLSKIVFFSWFFPFPYFGKEWRYSVNFSCSLIIFVAYTPFGMSGAVCGSDVDACLRLGPRGWFPKHWLGLTGNCEIIHCCFCSECCSGGYSQWLYHVSLNPSVKAEHKTGLYASAVSCIEPKQYRSQPKHLAGSKIWGAKMFDFRQITLFCLGCRLSKHKITVCSDNFERHGHLGPSLATPMNTVINIGDACSANRATYPGLL